MKHGPWFDWLIYSHELRHADPRGSHSASLNADPQALGAAALIGTNVTNALISVVPIGAFVQIAR
jgi:hypothetical protein